MFFPLAIKVWVFYINLVELCVSATDLGTDTYAQWTLELGDQQWLSPPPS